MRSLLKNIHILKAISINLTYVSFIGVRYIFETKDVKGGKPKEKIKATEDGKKQQKETVMARLQVLHSFSVLILDAFRFNFQV